MSSAFVYVVVSNLPCESTFSFVFFIIIIIITFRVSWYGTSKCNWFVFKVLLPEEECTILVVVQNVYMMFGNYILVF